MTKSINQTPGPWHFDGLVQIVEVARPHMRVAFLPSDHAEYASSEANGYLIAAAPDLLKALDELQDAEKIYRMCHDIDGDGHMNTGRAWDRMRRAGQRAREALAKVTQGSTETFLGSNRRDA